MARFEFRNTADETRAHLEGNTPLDVSDLLPPGTYAVRVMSEEAPQTITVEASVGPAPGPVTGLIVAPGDGQNALLWDAVVSDPPVTEYYVEADFGGGFAEIDPGPGSNTFITQFGLTNDVTVNYRVRAYNGTSFGPYSDIVSGTPTGTLSMSVVSDGATVTLESVDGSNVIVTVDGTPHTVAANEAAILAGPISAVLPETTGDTAQFGSRSTGSGTWLADAAHPPPTFGFAWEDDGVPIPGANSSTITNIPDGLLNSVVTATQSGTGATSVDSAAVSIALWTPADANETLVWAPFNDISEFRDAGGNQAVVGGPVHTIINSASPGVLDMQLIVGRTPGTLRQFGGRYYIEMSDGSSPTTNYSTGTEVSGAGGQVVAAISAGDDGVFFNSANSQGLLSGSGSTASGFVSEPGGTNIEIYNGELLVSDTTRDGFHTAFIYNSGAGTDIANRRLLTIHDWRFDFGAQIAVGQKSSANSNSVDSLLLWGVWFGHGGDNALEAQVRAVIRADQPGLA